MKTLLFKKSLLAFLFTWTILAGWSQEIPDSLLRYLEIAARNNPAVLQKFNEYQAALQKVPQAGSLSDPELSAGVFLKPMELVSGNQVADIRLMQMFPWFGVLKSARDEMSLMANARYELFRDAKLQVNYDVQRSWYEIFKIQKDISISEKNIEILKAIERLAIVKFQAPISSGTVTNAGRTSGNAPSSQNSGSGAAGMQSMAVSQGVFSNTASMQSSPLMQSGSMEPSPGMSGLSDLYRIQIETGELQNSIEMLKNQQNTITAKFNSYLNRPPATPVFVPDSFPLDTLEMSLSSVPDSILANNPMLSMLKFEGRSIDARKNMVKNMGYPMFGFGLNYSLIRKNEMSVSSMNGKDMVMPMVSVALPVYRKKYKAMITEAELLKTAISNNYDATANTLHTEYYQAVQLYKDALRRIKLYHNQFLLASKSLDLMLKSFSTSSSSLTDLLRIRQQVLDYELRQAEAAADLNTTTALLKRLMASLQIN